MNEKIQDQIIKAEESGAYFITVTYREDDTLKHWVLDSADFRYKDLQPSLNEIIKLLNNRYPGLKFT